MPITPSAIKKQRVDKKKTAINRPVLGKMKSAVKKAKTSPSSDTIREAYSAVDRALKRNVIKKNRASRIKSRLVAGAKNQTKTSVFAKSNKTTKSSEKSKSKTK